ncbi:hypothetical protein ACUHM8_003379 [Pseudomonas aeruginosa]
MSSTQHQLIEQCATRLRGIVEALDNIHDNTPHRWSTDLDDVHSSAESLLALIKDQAPTQAAQGLAGAALAQPSPASVCATPAGENCPGDGVKSCKKCPEQPEAERPEVVAYLFVKPDGTLSMDAVRHKPSQPVVAVMTVAQHDHIVGAVLRQKHEADTALAWATRHYQTVEQQRDAALARVAELEMLLRKLSTNGLMQFSTVDEEMAVQAALGGAPVSQAQQLHDLDKQCRDDVARALGLRPSQERGFAWSYLLTSIKSCVKASEDSAQAQHSVPDGAADLCRFLAKLYCELDGLRYSTAKLPAEQIADALIFKWPVLQGARNQLNIKRISEQPYDESKLHSAIAAMLAAAPGKEVPQAWLDVQAERRRQIEAEGWTPEHDDEHADGQMAQAAGCYALHAGGIGTDWPDGRQNGAALFWPWDRDSWKPTTPRRDLVKACALALAEIERLDRATATQGGPRDA